MLPPTGTVIPPNSNGAITQEIRVTNSMQGEKSLMFKLKVGFSVNGQTVSLLLRFLSYHLSLFLISSLFFSPGSQFEELTQVSFPPLY
jgi:hypothetical protein